MARIKHLYIPCHDGHDSSWKYDQIRLKCYVSILPTVWLDGSCNVEAGDRWDTEMPGHVEQARSRWDTSLFSDTDRHKQAAEENL